MTKGKTIQPIWHDITKDEVQKYRLTQGLVVSLLINALVFKK